MKKKKKGMAMGGKVKAKGMAAGGAVLPMGKDPKTGKSIPKFAMDGKGKMAKGGTVKAKGYANGGRVRAGDVRFNNKRGLTY